MNVLSLFDGMSGARIALDRAGIKVDNYFASEIKKHAIEVAQKNYPSTIQLGDIRGVRGNDLPKIDLLVGGSPCQDLTFINDKRKGLNGSKSRLFYEYLRVKRSLCPKFFLLENVASMKNDDKKIITDLLEVNPILINSNLVSAGDRRRYYWTNIPNVGQPQDRGILLSDIIEFGSTPEENMSEKKLAFIAKKRGGSMYVRVDGDKSMPITARGYSAWNTQFVTDYGGIRDLTLNEYKKIQTIPLEYQMDLIKSKATELIGDGFTIDVVAHILKHIP